MFEYEYYAQNYNTFPAYRRCMVVTWSSLTNEHGVCSPFSGLGPSDLLHIKGSK